MSRTVQPSCTGTRAPPLDGVSLLPVAIVPTVGSPPFSVGPMFLAHELGHTIGLPHVNPDPVAIPPAPAPSGPAFEILAAGGNTNTNMYYKDRLGWIPANRKYVPAPGSNQTIVLERSAQPPNAAGSFLMAQIPVPGMGPFASMGGSIVVEARRKFGNDTPIASEGVLISFVDPGEATINGASALRGHSVYFLDRDNDTDVNEQNSFLTVGESHSVAPAGLTIGVTGQNASSYSVSIAYSPPAGCTGDGFSAQYFDNPDLTAPVLTRVDPQHQLRRPDRPTRSRWNTSRTEAARARS